MEVEDNMNFKSVCTDEPVVSIQGRCYSENCVPWYLSSREVLACGLWSVHVCVCVCLIEPHLLLTLQLWGRSDSSVQILASRCCCLKHTPPFPPSLSVGVSSLLFFSKCFFFFISDRDKPQTHRVYFQEIRIEFESTVGWILKLLTSVKRLTVTVSRVIKANIQTYYTSFTTTALCYNGPSVM